MPTTTKNMQLPITFETRCTMQWMGKTDASGNNILEATYNADAYLFHTKIAHSDYNAHHKTESAAIRACAEAVRNLSR